MKLTSARKRKARAPDSRSRAAERELIALAKTMTLDEIVRRTGRTPESILKSARRLSVSIRSKPSKP
jgi:hypothetical protein